jgi:hypothetical protein
MEQEKGEGEEKPECLRSTRQKDPSVTIGAEEAEKE